MQHTPVHHVMLNYICCWRKRLIYWMASKGSAAKCGNICANNKSKRIWMKWACRSNGSAIEVFMNIYWSVGRTVDYFRNDEHKSQSCDPIFVLKIWYAKWIHCERNTLDVWQICIADWKRLWSKVNASNSWVICMSSWMLKVICQLLKR